VPDDRRPALVEKAKRRLDEVAVAPGEPQLEQKHWDLWVRGTGDIFPFTTSERTFAASCNDNARQWKQTPDGEHVLSRIIVAQFYSDLPPAAFRAFVQPENWPGCCRFWESVVGLPLNAPAPHVQTANGYDWDFAETVNIITKQLTVPLYIGFRELPDHSQIWTRFNLSQAYYTPATPVDVDTGTVSAVSGSNGSTPTLVKATKWVHWRDSTQPDLTAQACDFGWSELMEEMAYGCAQGFPPRALLAGMAADSAKTPADAIKQFVEAVTTECQQAIGQSGPHLEQLMGRFTGKSWDAGWINDLLDMGLVAADHYGNIAATSGCSRTRCATPWPEAIPRRRGKVMAENDLVRIRPADVAKVWSTAFGQIVDLWRKSLTALMELGSGEQDISAGQSAQFTLLLAGGRLPRLTARNMVGMTYGEQLDSRLVLFTETISGPSSVTVECSVDEMQQKIKGDIYVGEVVDEAGNLVARISLDAGS
jgi:hypothetical protein